MLIPNDRFTLFQILQQQALCLSLPEQSEKKAIGLALP
jgi:hypothetical protein|tara:strand:+ start:660 stop:773 length:114 start_codon:yes stop_codon:yes gene_type:complete